VDPVRVKKTRQNKNQSFGFIEAVAFSSEVDPVRVKKTRQNKN
jgi:hypothetical protein